MGVAKDPCPPQCHLFSRQLRITYTVLSFQYRENCYQVSIAGGKKIYRMEKLHTNFGESDCCKTRFEDVQ